MRFLENLSKLMMWKIDQQLLKKVFLFWKTKSVEQKIINLGLDFDMVLNTELNMDLEGENEMSVEHNIRKTYYGRVLGTELS